MVTSSLDYCNVLYIGLPSKRIWKLQLVQNAAAGAVMCTPKTVHITLLCHEVASLLLGLIQCAGFNLYKVLHGRGWGCLRNQFFSVTLAPFTWSDTVGLWQAPLAREPHLVGPRRCAFLCQGAHIMENYSSPSPAQLNYPYPFWNSKRHLRPLALRQLETYTNGSIVETIILMLLFLWFASFGFVIFINIISIAHNFLGGYCLFLSVVHCPELLSVRWMA